MIQSMTGFGKAKEENSQLYVNVEIRSLNGRSLDLYTKLPKEFSEFEPHLRTLLNEELDRGKINIKIDVDHKHLPPSRLRLNKHLFEAYIAELRDGLTSAHAEHVNLTEYVLNLPDVMSPSEDDTAIKEKQWAFIEKVVRQAAEKVKEFRLQEGNSMLEDFKRSIKAIGDHLQEIEQHDGERLEKLKQKWKERLAELEGAAYDENRLEQELIFYAEKLDINEEKVRLKSHLDYFEQSMLEDDKQEKGKKLGFIAQEINREINTIGSKANHAKIQHLVVQMKEEQDKIKEQLANIL